MAALPPPNPDKCMPTSNGCLHLEPFGNGNGGVLRFFENGFGDTNPDSVAAGEAYTRNFALACNGPAGGRNGSNGNSGMPNYGPGPARGEFDNIENGGMPNNGLVRTGNTSGGQLGFAIPIYGLGLGSAGNGQIGECYTQYFMPHQHDPANPVARNIPVGNPVVSIPNEEPATAGNSTIGNSGMPNNGPGPIRSGNGHIGTSGQPYYMPSYGHAACDRNNSVGNSGLLLQNPGPVRTRNSSVRNSGHPIQNSGPGSYGNRTFGNSGMPYYGPGPSRAVNGQIGTCYKQYYQARPAAASSSVGNSGLPISNSGGAVGVRSGPIENPSWPAARAPIGVNGVRGLPSYGPERCFSMALISTVYCPICTNLLVPPVVTCANGHMCCSGCICQPCQSCRRCAQPITSRRNLVIEEQLELISRLPVPVPRRQLSVLVNVNHRGDCQFRPIQCLFRLPNDPGDQCLETVPFIAYMEHLRTKHNCFAIPEVPSGFAMCGFYPDRQTVQHVWNILAQGEPQDYFRQGSWFYPATLFRFNKCFIVNSAIEGSNFRFWVTTLQSEGDASQYSAVIRIDDGLNRNADLNLQAGVKVHNVHVTRDLMAWRIASHPNETVLLPHDVIRRTIRFGPMPDQPNQPSHLFWKIYVKIEKHEDIQENPGAGSGDENNQDEDYNEDENLEEAVEELEDEIEEVADDDVEIVEDEEGENGE